MSIHEISKYKFVPEKQIWHPERWIQFMLSVRMAEYRALPWYRRLLTPKPNLKELEEYVRGRIQAQKEGEEIRTLLAAALDKAMEAPREQQSSTDQKA